MCLAPLTRLTVYFCGFERFQFALNDGINKKAQNGQQLCLFSPPLHFYQSLLPATQDRMSRYDTIEDFETVFADPPDAVKLLKQVLSKESIRAIERERGVNYTRVSDSQIINISNGKSYNNSENQDTNVQQQQRNASTPDDSSTEHTRTQTRFTKLNTKKDGTHQRLICLALRFLLTQIPPLMSNPFVHSKFTKQGVWVRSFSTNKNSGCMDWIAQNLTTAEPQFAGITTLSLCAFYSRFVQMGKELMEFFGEDSDLGEKKKLDQYLKRRRYHYRIQRTFLSEATIQLARLDLEYRTRPPTEADGRKQDEAGSQKRKRKVGHTFADDEDYAVAENDEDSTSEDEGDDEEALDERGTYHTRKRVATLQSSRQPLPASLWAPQPHPQSPETTVEETSCSSPTSSTSTSTAQEQQQQNLQRAKSVSVQLSHTLETTVQVQGQSHLDKTLTSLKNLLVHSRQQQQARLSVHKRTPALNAQLNKAKADVLARKTATTTLPATVVAEQQRVWQQQQPHKLQHQQQPRPQLRGQQKTRHQQQVFSRQGVSSNFANIPSTLPTTYTPATTIAPTNINHNNSNSSSIRNDPPQPTNCPPKTANHPPQAVNHLPGLFYSLEDMIRSFGQDLKVQMTGLKTAFENQQLQMIHLQSAVEDQQRQLTVMRETLDNFVGQSTPSNTDDSSNNNNGSNGGRGKSKGRSSTGPAPNAPTIAVSVPVTTRQRKTAGIGTGSRFARSRKQKQYGSSSTAPPRSRGTITSIVPASFSTVSKTTATAPVTHLAQCQAQQPPPMRMETSNTGDDDSLSATVEALMVASTKGRSTAVAKAGLRTTSTTAEFYRPAPSSQPPASVGIDASGRSAWALDMITISEIAAAAVADLDRQLTKEQSMIQQWPSSPLDLYRERQQE
ncbi:MAG: hypothetical protein J3R72DRAFT_462965 [Linnemannia gamsii]|nr:MAG: hypothetical protein J3R72DRAFT_462965 [Linnemannia gamsii]